MKFGSQFTLTLLEAVSISHLLVFWQNSQHPPALFSTVIWTVGPRKHLPRRSSKAFSIGAFVIVVVRYIKSCTAWFYVPTTVKNMIFAVQYHITWIIQVSGPSTFGDYPFYGIHFIVYSIAGSIIDERIYPLHFILQWCPNLRTFPKLWIYMIRTLLSLHMTFNRAGLSSSAIRKAILVIDV